MNKFQERGGKTILVVEDAEDVRRLICSMLEQRGYAVREAADGREALCLLDAEGDSVDLVLTDVIMPHMDGTELARQLAEIRPHLRIVFMSGYSEDPIVHGLGHAGACFLYKPFTANALVDKVQGALALPWNGLWLMNPGSAPP